MSNPDVNPFKIIEQEKAIFKIVTKTKNEVFFIEKWIRHHSNILQDTKLIIFDNMSDDKYVLDIYKKYKDNIILFRFDWYMDCLHMASYFIQLYKSLAISSKFFTIIDSDEFLYLYDCDGTVVKDSSIVQFLEKNTDCSFFAPCWIENVANNEHLLSFEPQNLSLIHMGKPIINTNTIPLFEVALTKYECPTLHHTHELPILTYGKAPVKFLLLHLKNLNKHQRIKSNMQKLKTLNIVKHDKDFTGLIKLDISTISDKNGCGYIIETRKLVDEILHTNDQLINKKGIIKLCDDGKLQFTPESYERAFKNLMDSDYFDLINFDISKVDIDQYTTIRSCMHLL